MKLRNDGGTLKNMPDSVRLLDSRNCFVTAIDKIPFVKVIQNHSITADRGKGRRLDPTQAQNSGRTVPCRNSRLDGADSELASISHTTQASRVCSVALRSCAVPLLTAAQLGRATLRERRPPRRCAAGGATPCHVPRHECEKCGLVSMPFGSSTPRRQGIEWGAPLESRRDSVLQPRVARNEPPWVTAGMAPNPNGVETCVRQRPQPRWGCCIAPPVPRVARSSQPWALIRNPVGIPTANIRKALGLVFTGGHWTNRSPDGIAGLQRILLKHLRQSVGDQSKGAESPRAIFSK